MIHFGLIFAKGIKSVPRFIFFACGHSVVLASFVKKIYYPFQWRKFVLDVNVIVNSQCRFVIR